MQRHAVSLETTYIAVDQQSHVVGGGSFSFTSPPLMSPIYFFLGELISIHWVYLARRNEVGRKRERARD